MKRVPTVVVKNRSRRATTFFESYTCFDHLMGTIQDVLITEASNDGTHYVGHNKSYQQVLVPKDPRIMGQKVQVKIIQTSKWFVKGEVLGESLQKLGSVSPKRVPHLVRSGKDIVEVQQEQKQIIVTEKARLLRLSNVSWMLAGAGLLALLCSPLKSSSKFLVAASSIIVFSSLQKK